MTSDQKMTNFIERHEARLQQQKDYVSRKRINALLDPQSFVEMNSSVESRRLNFGFEREPVAGDGVVTGFGTINDNPVYIAAQEPSVYGGSIGEIHALKIVEAINAAVEADVPFILIPDSGGARIEEAVISLQTTGQLLATMRFADDYIPIITMIAGNCPGALSMLPEYSDFVLMNDAAGAVFVNGPMVVQATEGKGVDVAALGGAAVRAANGYVSIRSADEAAMIEDAKALVDLISEERDFADDPNRAEDLLDQIAQYSDRQGFAAGDIADAVFDQGSMIPLYADYAPEVYTALASLDGETVGCIIQTAPRMNADHCRKLAKFVDLCDAFDFPLINFVQGEGFEISSEAEKNLSAAAADLYAAYVDASMIKITVIIGKLYGSAWQVLNANKAYNDVLYAWPTAEIAVVPSETAASIIYGKEFEKADDPVKARQDFIARYAEEVATPELSEKLGYINEIIMPRATRPRLISALRLR